MTTMINNSVRQELAPTGKMRTLINLGNPILAKWDAAKGQPYGVSVDLANVLAARLGVDLEFIVMDAAGKCVEALTHERADVGFFAIDPIRGAGIHFTSPYVLIEGAYLVPRESAITVIADVDAEGNRVAVGQGSAYDLFLTREVKRATLVRVATSPAVVDEFINQRLEVAAGVRQQLEADAQRIPGLRMLKGRFMVIRQAMGVPKNRSPQTHRYLDEFIEDLKVGGFVEDALRRHEISGAAVAPPENAVDDE